MSLALKITLESITGAKSPYYLYFDAVTSYNRSFANTVSKHGISDGRSIADHIISENQTIQFSGIISDADLEAGVPTPYRKDGVEVTLGSMLGIMPVRVSSDSTFVDFLPSSITQFLSSDPPQVELQALRENRQNRMKELLIAARNKNSTVALVEYDEGGESELIDNLVIVGLAFDENADSGDALFVAINLEQVTFVKLVKESIPAGAVIVNKETGKNSQEKNSATANVDKGFNSGDYVTTGESARQRDAKARLEANNYSDDVAGRAKKESDYQEISSLKKPEAKLTPLKDRTAHKP